MNFDHAVQEFSVARVFLEVLNNSVVLESSIIAFLRLESREDGAWPLQLVQELLIVLDGIVYLLVDSIDPSPVLVFDVCTAGPQPLNDLVIVECKRDLGYLDRHIVALSAIKAEIGHAVQPFLQLVLDVKSELGDFGNWVRLVQVALEEVLVQRLLEIEFYRVITGRNCLYIPLDVLVGLNALDVVDIDDGEQVYEDAQTAHDQSSQVARIPLSWIYEAGYLDEEHRVVTTRSVLQQKL